MSGLLPGPAKQIMTATLTARPNLILDGASTNPRIPL